MSIDRGGALQIGPQSAGADLGPVCYDMGGSEPTVTDANLILGYLNPRHLVGGELMLDKARAKAMFKDKVKLFGGAGFDTTPMPREQTDATTRSRQPVNGWCRAHA